MFKYSLDNKKYHTLNYDLTKRFGTRVFKVSLNGNFSCPNFVNGSGCIFCSSYGSGDFAGNKNDSLKKQFEDIKSKLNNKWPDTKYIAYFQANTNTYAPVNILKRKFEEVLTFPNVVGLNIGTRPDAISDECLKYLIDLNKRTFLTIELGLQSMHNETLKLINRGHDLQCFDDCVKKLRQNNINVVVHIINGLPYETEDMMIKTIKHLNKLDIQGIKIHMLHILKNTKLAEIYKKDKFHLLTKEEYVNIVCNQIEELNDNIVIHRLTGDGSKEDLIEPLWTLKKVSVLNDIDKELKKRGTYQGFNKSILNRVKLICKRLIKPGDITIDATCGNGNDTLMLCNLSKKVFAFDVQLKAINNTKILLDQNNIKNYELINDSNEYIYDKLNKYKNKISLIIYNLGYLPGGNKKIMTNHKSTIISIKNGLKLLNNKGIILVTCYPHKEGKIESKELINYLNQNSIKYVIYKNTDNINAPFLIEIYKKNTK